MLVELEVNVTSLLWATRKDSAHSLSSAKGGLQGPMGKPPLAKHGTVVADGLAALSEQLRGVIHGCGHAADPHDWYNWGEGAFP